METYMTQLLLVGVILVELVIYWSLPKGRGKRRYKHTEAYLLARKLKINKKI